MKTRVINLGLSLALCLAFSACNKEEFYEKEYLVTPTDVPSTDGSANGGSQAGVDGGAGSTQGGVDSGAVDGGSTGGSTTGSTTGGTDGGSTGETNEVETFYQSAQQTKKLDIVWIVDNSGSMNDEQDALGHNFSAFIDDFINKRVDFKMAIITTDASSSEKKGRMVTGSDVKLTSAKAMENEAQFKSDFNSLIKVGVSGSGQEKGLAASEGFMQKYASTFVRQDAYLAVVVVSDEEDQSSKTVAAYTDYLKSFKNTAGLVKVYSVVDVNNTNTGGYGITTGSERYKQASSNTAGLIADIRADFHSVLTQMGDNIINLLDSFALSNTPRTNTLKVYVNGVESFDYTYDSASRSIKFNQTAIPPIDAEIKVFYECEGQLC